MLKEKLARWRREALSIPNLLSYLRLALIPIFCTMYARGQYLITTFLVILSGLTDTLDGFIARHFHMITEWGKIVDPVADKLTQLALVLCLLQRYSWLIWVVILLVAKELFMMVMGVIVLRRQYEIEGAIWCGKASTMAFYIVMIALLFFPYMPSALAAALGGICGAMLSVSFIGYAVFYYKLMHHKKA